MTVAAQLADLKHAKLDVTLFIEGIPLVFGTRAGLSHPLEDMDGNVFTAMGTTTSVSAIPWDGLSIGQGALNWESLIVEPGTCTVNIASASSWDEYFMRRLNESFDVMGSLTYAGTTLNWPYAVTDGQLYGLTDPSGRIGTMLYCERESMLVTDVDLGTWTFTVTRGYADFPGAQSMHAAGTTLSWSPPQWIGRRCELRIWLGDTTQRVIYGVIQDSPAFDKAGQTWRIVFKDTLAMLDRKLALGMTGGTATGYMQEAAIGDRPAVVITPSPDWLDEVGDNTAAEKGHVLVKDSEDHAIILPILQFNNSGATFSVDASRAVIDIDIEKVAEARRCYVFRGYPMRAALTVLMSKAGGLTQTVTVTGSDQPIGDRLFGQVLDTPDAEDQALGYGQEKRFGAALHKLFLDVHSSLSTSDLGEAVRTFTPGFCYCLGLNGEEDLIGFLSEVAHACGGFWFMNYKGQISFRRLAAYYPGVTPAGRTTHTVTDSDIARDGTSWVSLDDESEAIATQTIECNWDPVSGKFLATFNLIDQATHNAYREKANNIKAQRRGLYVRVPGAPQEFTPGLAPGAMDREVFRTQMERITQARNKGLRKYNLRLPWKYSQMQPGDHITLTCAHLIDFTGRGITVSGMRVMPTQVRLDVKGAWVDVECVEVKRGLVLPPVLQVASYDAGTKTITLVSGGSLEWDETDNTRPADYVDVSGASFDQLRLLDESATPAYSATATLGGVTVPSATTLVLSGVPSIAPAAGDLIVVYPYETPPATSINAYGQTVDDFAVAQWYLDGTNPLQSGDPYGQSIIIDGADYPVRRWT
jgi:hypothetical protein